MVVVLVKWKIKLGCEDEARAHWAQNLPIEDCSGLVGEFLCEPGSEEYDTWSLPDHDDPPCTIFVNVGIWTDEEAFQEQVAKYFNNNKKLEPFEAARRVRTVLKPMSWRMGCAPLPDGSSEGVR